MYPRRFQGPRHAPSAPGGSNFHVHHGQVHRCGLRILSLGQPARHAHGLPMVFFLCGCVLCLRARAYGRQTKRERERERERESERARERARERDKERESVCVRALACALKVRLAGCAADASFCEMACACMVVGAASVVLFHFWPASQARLFVFDWDRRKARQYANGSRSAAPAAQQGCSAVALNTPLGPPSPYS